MRRSREVAFTRSFIANSAMISLSSSTVLHASFTIGAASASVMRVSFSRAIFSGSCPMKPFFRSPSFLSANRRSFKRFEVASTSVLGSADASALSWFGFFPFLPLFFVFFDDEPAAADGCSALDFAASEALVVEACGLVDADVGAGDFADADREISALVHSWSRCLLRDLQTFSVRTWFR